MAPRARLWQKRPVPLSLPKERPSGRIKSTPEDFVVDEIPAYEPAGSGDHLYVHLRKRGRTTDDVAREIARALGVKPGDVGFAGMKDKVAVTTQWMSFPAGPPSADREAALRALSIEGVELLTVSRHGNKLRTGHLRGNRFDLVVRDLPEGGAAEVARTLSSIAEHGAPNAFGEQRFGRQGDNAERARAWLAGRGDAPRDHKVRRLLFSAWQSAIFNAVLEARLADGTWNVPIEGDVLRKEESGGLFLCSDVQTDRERAAAGEVCPTGPLPGPRMTKPTGAALALEERVSAPFMEGVDLSRAKNLGDGARRPLVIAVRTVEVSEIGEQGRACRVRFVLPKGAYATTVLGFAVAFEADKSASAGAPSGIQAETQSDDEPTEIR